MEEIHGFQIRFLRKACEFKLETEVVRQCDNAGLLVRQWQLDSKRRKRSEDQDGTQANVEMDAWLGKAHLEPNRESDEDGSNDTESEPETVEKQIRKLDKMVCEDH